MKKRIKMSLFAGLIILLAACATVENFEESVNSWVGGDIQRLLNAWKAPDKVRVLQNGNSEYEYNITQGNALPNACIVFFEVDRSNGKIIHIRHEGIRCKRAPSFV